MSSRRPWLYGHCFKGVYTGLGYTVVTGVYGFQSNTHLRSVRLYYVFCLDREPPKIVHLFGVTQCADLNGSILCIDSKLTGSRWPGGYAPACRLG